MPRPAARCRPARRREGRNTHMPYRSVPKTIALDLCDSLGAQLVHDFVMRLRLACRTARSRPRRRLLPWQSALHARARRAMATEPQPRERVRAHNRNSTDCASTYGVGRNTQTAAGSPGLARAATKSRSTSGTNSDVRAPDIVGTCAARRYAAPCASNTSRYPSPQLRYTRWRFASTKRSSASPHASTVATALPSGMAKTAS